MYIINKSGNYGIITPLPIGSLASTLDKYLQYERQGKQFMPNPLWAIQRLYRMKTGVFPWGLLSIVKNILDKYCETHHEEYSISYKALPIKELEKMPDLRPYQLEAVTALVKHQGGIVCLPTGSGKTIILIEYLKFMKLRSLVIVPTIDIRKQWQDYHVKDMVVSTYQNPMVKIKSYIEQFDIIVFDECHHVSAKSLYNIAMKVKTNTILIGCSATI